MTTTPAPVSPPLLAFAQAMRSEYRATIPAAGTPDPVAEVRSLSIAADHPPRQIPVRLYLPARPDRTPLPVVVFMHGGGFVSGDLDTHDVLTRALANSLSAIVIAVDYRLAPEHPFPAGAEDGYAVLAWASTNADQLGGDAARIAVAGDSAGGNLATVMAMLARDRRGPGLVAQLLMYPSVGNKMDTPSWQQLGDRNFPTRQVMQNVLAAYVPQGMGACDSLIAPLWADLQGLPATLLQVGEQDPLRDEGSDYATQLAAAGVSATAIVYPGAVHGFIQFFKDTAHHPLGAQGLRDGVAFLRDAFSR
jgi:acetyl esterase